MNDIGVDDPLFIPADRIARWAITEQEIANAAQQNFSNAMMDAMLSNNTLRLLRQRTGSFRFPRGANLRPTVGEASVTYIPFGLVVISGRAGVARSAALRTQSQRQYNFGHYASHNVVKNFSFGINRFRFFFHQLASSSWIQSSNGRRFGVHMVFHSPEGINWAEQITSDFGTLPAGAAPNTIPTVTLNTPATFPYNMFVLPEPNGAVSQRTTPLYLKSAGVSAPAFAQILREAAKNVMPENGASGQSTNLRLVNLFLVVVEGQAGGGGPRGPYWLTADAPGDEWIVNPKAVLSPARTERNTCFWECVLLCLCMRQEAEDSYTAWYDLWVRELCLPGQAGSRQRAAQLKRIQLAVEAFKAQCRLRGLELHDERVSVDAVQGWSDLFGFESCAVVNVEGEALVGTTDDLYSRRPDTNHLVLLFQDSHYSVVTSYTCLVPVKECPACGQRFATTKTFEAHLKSKTCLKCECLTKLREHVTPFQSIAAWRHHRANLETECLFRTRTDLVPAAPKSERERNALRFPHDKDSTRKYGRWVREEFEDAMTEDLSPVRQYKEALYVDLESVVPMNAVDVTRQQLRFHEPYAIGWIRRTDAEQGMQPTLEYGMDCMQRFFAMLDSWWEELLADEAAVWLQRCREEMVLDPHPRVTRGKRNFAAKIELSWNTLVKKGGAQCPVCCQLVEEHVGWKHECALLYWSRNVAQKNMHEDFNNNAPRITVWAHNGGRYDWLFVHRYLIERNLLHLARVCRGGGRYYEIAYRGVFLFRDSLNFVMGSLDRLGKDFQVETLKGIFPYRYLEDSSRIYDVLTGEEVVRARLPAELFEVTDTVDGAMGLNKKRAFTDAEYVEFMTERGWVYDVRAETEKYLAADILCLYQVLESFRSGWQQLPYQPELFKFCTIGQMCHSYFLTHYLHPRAYPTLDVMEDTFIRQALYGGRTEVFQRCIAEPLPIHYVDVNSLYPHVMESCALPSGDPIWHFEQSDPRYAVFRASTFDIHVQAHTPSGMLGAMHRLNACDPSLYGFFEVDVDCPADAMFPVLPERRNGKNMFTNCVKRRMVYYSEELKFAIQRGACVLRVHAWCEWTPSKVYSQLISVLKAEKMRGEGKDVEGRPIPGASKNPSLRAAAKTAQNALYGKSIQFINESVQIVDNQESLYKLIRTPESDVSIEPIFRGEHHDVVEVTVRPHKPKVQRRSCSAIGTAILAEARMVLYRYFEEVMRVNGTILYCDTDSIVFAGTQGLPAHCLSDAVYGKMKVEIDPDDIVPGGFVALAPKCYSFLLKDGSPYVKCKGVNLSTNINLPAEDGFEELLELMEADEMLELVVGEELDEAVKGLSFENLRLMIMGQKKKLVTSQMQFLKTRDRHVAAVDTVKLLTDQFDKRKILSGGLTVAWNEYNVNIDSAIEARDAGRVSNFLRYCAAEEIHWMHEKRRGDAWFISLFNSWLDSHEAPALYYISCFLE